LAIEKQPLISIVVLNWNGLDDTKICLEHLRHLDYPNFEIVLVDNGSSSDQKDYLRALTDVVFVDNPVNRGFTGGHIDGFKRASGEFIMLLNNDAVIQKDYLKIALKDFSDPSVAAVGGRSYFWNKEQPLLDTQNAFYAYQEIDPVTGEARMMSSDFGVKQEVNNVSGSATIIRRSVIDEVGYLYDRFFAYFEETDLFARIKRAGFKVIYDPRLCIWHRNGASSGASSGSYFFYYQIFRNRFIFAARNFDGRSLAKFFLIYTKISGYSLAKYLLKRPNPVMNKAYFMAGLYNLFHLLPIMVTRFQLGKSLGSSNYNQIIWNEQTGLSFVFDCTSYKEAELSRLVTDLGVDKNPLHEYVLISSNEQEPKSPSFQPNNPNLRFITDRGYFIDNNPLNLGCLAARFDWMVICENNPLSTKTISNIRKVLYRTKKSVFTPQEDEGHANTFIVNKRFFKLIGGFDNFLKRSELTVQLLEYSKIADGNKKTTDLNLVKKVSVDRLLEDSSKVDFIDHFSRTTHMPHRIQIGLKWLFSRRITIRHKFNRLIKLIVFTVLFQKTSVKLELKHIYNEYVVNSNPIDLNKNSDFIKIQATKLLGNPSSLPIFIICRDRVDDLKKLVNWLDNHGLKKIIFIDNDSTYPPLVKYLEETPYQVIKLYRNVGHTCIWSLGIARTLAPRDFYLVSDPDVLPVEECPADWLNYLLKIHIQSINYIKVGLGLRIDDLPDRYPLKQQVIDWESQFQQKPLSPGLYEAGVDTTFALYKPFSYDYTLHPSLRTGFPYVARHLPWYIDPTVLSDEEKYYRFRADHNVSSWNSDTLEDRYDKEMNK